MTDYYKQGVEEARQAFVSIGIGVEVETDEIVPRLRAKFLEMPIEAFAEPPDEERDEMRGRLAEVLILEGIHDELARLLVVPVSEQFKHAFDSAADSEVLVVPCARGIHVHFPEATDDPLQ